MRPSPPPPRPIPFLFSTFLFSDNAAPATNGRQALFLFSDIAAPATNGRQALFLFSEPTASGCTIKLYHQRKSETKKLRKIKMLFYWWAL